VKYLLDTNVVSDSRRPRAIAVLDWIATQPASDLAISVITLLELEWGVRRKERADPVGGRPLRRWLDEQVRPSFDGRILAVDERVALTAASFHVPDPMPEMDGLIAATASAHGLTLVTRNVRDVEHTGVRILDPWER